MGHSCCPVINQLIFWELLFIFILNQVLFCLISKNGWSSKNVQCYIKQAVLHHVFVPGHKTYLQNQTILVFFNMPRVFPFSCLNVLLFVLLLLPSTVFSLPPPPFFGKFFVETTSFGSPSIDHASINTRAVCFKGKYPLPTKSLLTESYKL